MRVDPTPPAAELYERVARDVRTRTSRTPMLDAEDVGVLL